MPGSRSHNREYFEPERHDGLSEGVRESITPVRAGGQKRYGGRFLEGDAGTKEAAKKGGSSHKASTLLSHRIDAPTLTPESGRRARTLRRALSGEIAATVGGGRCGIAASLFLKFAAQKTAAGEEAFQRGDYEAHRKLTESARMDILYAREHAAKEALARAKGTPSDPHAALVAAVNGGGT